MLDQDAEIINVNAHSHHAQSTIPYSSSPMTSTTATTMIAQSQSKDGNQAIHSTENQMTENLPPPTSGGSNESHSTGDTSINNSGQENSDQKHQQQQQHHISAHHHHHGHHGNTTNSSSIGHYELKRTLGKGNFSTVKLAQHKITNHSVAIKIVKFSDLSKDNLMKINREIDVLKKLGKHNHIVRLYQVIKTKRYFFLVTEYCKNGELYDYLVAKGKLSEPQSCNYFLQILSAVEYLHEHNVVHRDLKAENLLLTKDYQTVKIADFGFANYFKQDNLLSTWCGSPPYAAPELFKGLHYVGPRVDIWSMGVILYVLVCGSLPFDGQSLVHLKSRVLSGKFRIPFFMTSECESLVRGMLRLDPEKRFSIKQIKAHSWIQKYGDSSLAAKYSSVIGKQLQPMQTESRMSSYNRLDDKTTKEMHHHHHHQQQQITSTSRGQSLEMDEDDKKIKSPDLQANEDASMLCLTNSTDVGDERAPSTNSNPSATRNKIHLSRNGVGRVIPPNMRNFVDTDIANAVSNMSIDSYNSSMSVSQSIETTNTTSNHSSSITSSRCCGQTRDCGSSCTHSGSVRQFSKESSIDDQIIDFMVDNLKVAENQNSIRQSIANNKYDDLHAIYKLLKDQPEMVLEAAKFKIPSLPLISPNRDATNKKPSITTGFFNLNQVNLNDRRSNTSSRNESEKMRVVHREAHNSNPYKLKSPHHYQQQQNRDLYERVPGSDMTKPESRSQDQHESVDTSFVQRQRSSVDQAWITPPQFFLTPPAENKNQAQLNNIPDSSKYINNQMSDMQSDTNYQDLCSAARHIVARHSFDSTVSNFAKQCEIAMDSNLAERGAWDSSLLDTQMNASMTPTTPVMLRDGLSISTSYSDNQGENQDSLKLIQNLAKITTNLPQIGSEGAAPNFVNHNLLLAQLNSTTCTAAMTQSGLLSKHESSIEQRLQSTGPIKFTPNNLINQNYTAINNLALQNTLKNAGIPSASLLDPEGLMSGFERRASDGQASYSSLTVTNSDQSEQGLSQQNAHQGNRVFNRNQQTSVGNVDPSFQSNSASPLSLAMSHQHQAMSNNDTFAPGPRLSLIMNQQQQFSNTNMQVRDGIVLHMNSKEAINLTSDDADARPLDLSNKQFNRQ